LNDPVGENHSSLKWNFSPSISEPINGVQPSPNEIGSVIRKGNDLAYRQIDRSDASISARAMPGRSLTINGFPFGARQRDPSSGYVCPVAGSMKVAACVILPSPWFRAVYENVLKFGRKIAKIAPNYRAIFKYTHLSSMTTKLDPIDRRILVTL
jgi:hypothetical protein